MHSAKFVIIAQRKESAKPVKTKTNKIQCIVVTNALLTLQIDEKKINMGF